MHTVMVIDDSRTELIVAEKALEGSYRVLCEQNAKHALEILKKTAKKPSLILLDIEMPVFNGFEFFSQIRADDKFKEIPVIFVSGNSDTATELEAYQLGAVDFVVKPFVAEILKRKVNLHIGIVEDKLKLKGQNITLQDYNEQLQDYNDELQTKASGAIQHAQHLEYFIIGIITDLIAKKDGYTGVHSKRVSQYMSILLRQMMKDGTARYPIKDIDLILMSAQLFEMGKIGLPDIILEKVGKYTPEEFELMKMHTIYAADSIEKFAYLLPDSPFITYIYQMARSHHEQWCGKGYPDGLAGPHIPQLARIISVCDVYDALVSKRPYKKEMTHEQAFSIINQASGIQFDPQIVEAFNKVHMDFYDISNVPGGI
ncbi:MAG: response regulator [Lachnospiraceae bacterium]|nr:response regulator [Lachnospiraceae bacterium]